MLLQHLLHLRWRLGVRQLFDIKPCFGQCRQDFFVVCPLACGALGHQLPARHLDAVLQQLLRHVAGVLDVALQQVDLPERLGQPVHVDRLDGRAGGAGDGTAHHRADRLGRTPAAVVAGGQRRVGLLGSAHRQHQFSLELLDAGGRRHPALHIGRLDDDDLDVLDVRERPLGLRGAKGGSDVEEALRVLFRAHRDAVAELPIQQHATVANPAHKISGTEHARQSVAKADDLLDGVFHRLVGVDLVKGGEGRQQLALQQVFGQFDGVVGGAQELMRRLARLQDAGDGVVQQRAGVGVDRRRLRGHLLDERDTAGAGHDALGG